MSSSLVAVAAAVISAMAALMAAGVSAFMSWTTLRRTSAQKLAEMREAWIDDLRNNLAEFVGTVHHILNEASSVDLDSPPSILGGLPVASQNLLRELNAKLNRIESYIIIKLNTQEEAARRLIEVMAQLRGCAAVASNHLDSVVVARSHEHLGEFVSISGVIVKSEWQRVKNDITPVSHYESLKQRDRFLHLLATIPNTCTKYTSHRSL